MCVNVCPCDLQNVALKVNGALKAREPDVSSGTRGRQSIPTCIQSNVILFRWHNLSCFYNHLKRFVWSQMLLLFRHSVERLNVQKGYFTLIGAKAPPAARDTSEVARALNQRCYPHTGNGGHSGCLSSSLTLSV